jgi:hypothetical protein
MMMSSYFSWLGFELGTGITDPKLPIANDPCRRLVVDSPRKPLFLASTFMICRRVKTTVLLPIWHWIEMTIQGYD